MKTKAHRFQADELRYATVNQDFFRRWSRDRQRHGLSFDVPDFLAEQNVCPGCGGRGFFRTDPRPTECKVCRGTGFGTWAAC